MQSVNFEVQMTTYLSDEYAVLLGEVVHAVHALVRVLINYL